MKSTMLLTRCGICHIKFIRPRSINLGLPQVFEGSVGHCRSSITSEVQFKSSEVTGVPNDIALCLYRVAQEALNNAIKHGKAKQIQVQLEQTQNFLHLTVMNSGAGFDPWSRPPLRQRSDWNKPARQFRLPTRHPKSPAFRTSDQQADCSLLRWRRLRLFLLSAQHLI
jgi:hypothetical protein